MPDRVLTEPRRLAALATCGLLAEGPDDALDNISALAADLLEAPVALISIVAADRQLFRGRCGLDPAAPNASGTSLRYSFCQNVVRQAAPFSVEDALNDPAVRDHPAVVENGFQAYLGEPLVLATGEILGSLCVLDYRPRRWTATERERLRRLARTAVAEIQQRQQVHHQSAALLAQQAAETELQAVFDSTPLPVWVYDIATLEFLEVNGAATATYQYDRAAFLRMTLRDIRPPEEVPRLLAAVSRVRRGQPMTTGGRYVHQRRDGSRLEVELHSVPLIFRGRAARLVVVRDVTAVQRAERELHLLRAAVRQLNDLVFVLEAEGRAGELPRLLFVNEAVALRTGRAPDAAILEPLDLLLGLESGSPDLARLRAGIEAGREIRLELPARDPEGAAFWLDLDVVPVTDGAGLRTHWVAVGRDITERRRLEEDLRQAQRLEAVGQLAGGVAHDFANIVAIIGASEELLRSRVESVPGVDADLDAIREAAVRARALVAQILAFSRRQVLDVKPVDLATILRRTEPMLRRLIEESITLDVQQPDTPVTALADETQIVQVLLNLASNARDAMPDGGVLQCTLDTAGSSARLRVRDTGCGIAPEHLPHLFEPFYTTKAPGRGTGLGLATVYGIVRQSGGSLDVQSSVGSGTVFTLQLPLAAPAEPPAATPAIAVTPSATLDGLHVLLVEDEASLRRATSRLLQRAGVRVLTAEDGLSALEQLRDAESQPDLVLTDLVMPGLGGRALAEALRELRPGLPVLFMSGYDPATAESAVGPVRAASFLQKPFDFAELEMALLEVSGRRTTVPE